MNLNMFDDINGLILRERENALEPKFSAAPRHEGLSRFPDNTPLAMAYVPFQQINQVYEPDKAMSAGTLFPELDLPFERGGAQQ